MATLAPMKRPRARLASEDDAGPIRTPPDCDAITPCSPVRVNVRSEGKKNVYRREGEVGMEITLGMTLLPVTLAIANCPRLATSLLLRSSPHGMIRLLVRSAPVARRGLGRMLTEWLSAGLAGA
jgi:hypothetical protein